MNMDLQVTCAVMVYVRFYIVLVILTELSM